MSSRSAKRNFLLDLLRFISSLFVVLIHCPLPGFWGNAIITFGRYAVPFFLMISGWYLFSYDRNVVLEKAIKQLCGIIKLIGAFFVVYLVTNSLCGIVERGVPFEWIKKYSNFTTVLYWLLFNRALFLGSTAYYIFMMLYIYIIIIFWAKYNLSMYMVYAAPALIVINIICGEFTDLPWFTYGNFLFTGIPCFAIGYLLHQCKDKIFSFSLVKYICLFVLGALIACFEAYATKTAYCHIGSILMAGSLLIICVRNNISYLPHIAQILHKYSTIIFIIHCGIRDVVRVAFLRLNISCSEYTFPFVVIAISIFICIVYDKVKNLIVKYASKLTEA